MLAPSAYHRFTIKYYSLIGGWVYRVVIFLNKITILNYEDKKTCKYLFNTDIRILCYFLTCFVSARVRSISIKKY